MSYEENVERSSRRKTNVLGINKVHTEAKMSDVLKPFDAFDVVRVKRFIMKKHEGVNFLVEFSTAEECEKAHEEVPAVEIDGEKLVVFYASSMSFSNGKKIVTDDKIHVQCRGADKDDVMSLFQDFKISKTESSSFFFVYCDGPDQQRDIIAQFNGRSIGSKSIKVSPAIGTVRPHSHRKSKEFSNE